MLFPLIPIVVPFLMPLLLHLKAAFVLMMSDCTALFALLLIYDAFASTDCHLCKSQHALFILAGVSRYKILKVTQKIPVVIAEVEMMPQEDDTSPKVSIDLLHQHQFSLCCHQVPKKPFALFRGTCIFADVCA